MVLCKKKNHKLFKQHVNRYCNLLRPAEKRMQHLENKLTILQENIIHVYLFIHMKSILGTYVAIMNIPYTSLQIYYKLTTFLLG